MSYARVPAGAGKRLPTYERLRYMYFLINRFLVRYPEECKYKQNTEAIVAYRQSIVECAQSMEEIECSINCGPLEQLISQAQRELALMKKLLPYRPWEPLVSAPPPHQWTWPITTD